MITLAKWCLILLMIFIIWNVLGVYHKQDVALIWLFAIFCIFMWMLSGLANFWGGRQGRGLFIMWMMFRRR